MYRGGAWRLAARPAWAADANFGEPRLLVCEQCH